MQREQRLRDASSGDQFGRPNFQPAMGDEQLLRGYADLMTSLYSPRAYFQRCMNYLDQVASHRVVFGGDDRGVLAVARIIFALGVISPHRFLFWRLLFKAAFKGAAAVRRSVAHALLGEHLIHYTKHHVLPRLAEAMAESAPSNRVGEERPPRFLPVLAAGAPAQTSLTA